MPSRTFAIVVSRVYLPPGWAKLWWFADDIQYDHQHKLQKKAPRFFSGRIHAPADSFISKNEGMNEPAGCNQWGRCQLFIGIMCYNARNYTHRVSLASQGRAAHEAL